MFDTILADQELFGLVRKKLEIFKTSLDSRRQDIFDKRILAETPVTLQKIGKRYGITKERVRQIEKGLKTDIKRYLQEAYPELQLSMRPALSRQPAGENRYLN
jgi:RNA polymerase sigma-32 factor